MSIAAWSHLVLVLIPVATAALSPSVTDSPTKKEPNRQMEATCNITGSEWLVGTLDRNLV
jgi:hypothetical protein